MAYEIEATKVQADLQEFYGQEKVTIKLVKGLDRAAISISERCNVKGDGNVLIKLNVTKIRSENKLQGYINQLKESISTGGC